MRTGLTDRRAALFDRSAATGVALVGRLVGRRAADPYERRLDPELVGGDRRQCRPQTLAELDLAGAHEHRAVRVEAEPAVELGVRRRDLRGGPDRSRRHSEQLACRVDDPRLAPTPAQVVVEGGKHLVVGWSRPSREVDQRDGDAREAVAALPCVVARAARRRRGAPSRPRRATRASRRVALRRRRHRRGRRLEARDRSGRATGSALLEPAPVAHARTPELVAAGPTAAACSATNGGRRRDR